MIVKTRSLARLALERSSSRVEWLMSDDGKRKLCFRWWACRDLPSTIFVDMLQARKTEQRVSTRSMSIFACSMHDIRARARVIHSWSACRSVATLDLELCTEPLNHSVFEPTRPQQQTETTSAGDVHKRKPAYLPKTWEVGTNSNCCNRAAAQVKQHIPEQPGWKNSK